MSMSTKTKQLALSVLASNGPAAPAAGVKSRGKKKGKARKANVDVSLPAAMGQIYRVGMPKFSGVAGSDGRMRVTHREYLCDVALRDVLTVRTFALNPGLSTSFPWLSKLAERFESYLFRSLRVVYVPTVGTSARGSVVMAVDYDAADSAPTDKVSLLSYHGAVKTQVWSPAVMACDRPDLQKFGVQRYIRYGTAPSPDIHAYDVGNLFVASYGADVSYDKTDAGEIYLEYTVDLITPQMSSSSDAFEESALIVPGGTVSLSRPFGTTPTIKGGLPLTLPEPEAGYEDYQPLAFSVPGQYLVSLTALGTLLADATPEISAYGAATYESAEQLVKSDRTASVAHYLINSTLPNSGVMLRWKTGAEQVLNGVSVRAAPYAYSLIS